MISEKGQTLVDPKIKKYLRSEFMIGNGLNPGCLDGIIRYTIEFGCRYLRNFDDLAKRCIVEQIEKFRKKVNDDCDQKIKRLNSVFTYENTQRERAERIKKTERKA